MGITLNDGQRAAFDAILSGANVFLTGEGGTGKSVVLREAVSELKRRGHEVVVCAYTGIAAQEVSGSTINSAFQFNFAPKVADVLRDVKVSKVVMEADTIIIDEVGMVRRDMMDAIVRVIEKANVRRPKKKMPIQLVVVGDFSQLPPVVTDKDMQPLLDEYGEGAGFYAFESAGWRRMDFRVCKLTEPMRQSDSEFVDMLNLARIGDTRCIDYFNSLIEKNGEAPEDAVRLVGTNRAADSINQRFLDSLPGEEAVYKGQIEDKFSKGDMSVPMELRLKVGARVILTAGDAGEGYVNGVTGTVTKLHCNSSGKPGIGVRLDDGNCVVVHKHTWHNIRYIVRDTGDEKKLDEVVNGTYTQYPIKLAWAMTFHKSQGQTLDAVQITPDNFAAGQLYVGLSRATRPDGLWLTRPMREEDLICADSVKNFYLSECDVAGMPTPRGIAAYKVGRQPDLFESEQGPLGGSTIDAIKYLSQIDVSKLQSEEAGRGHTGHADANIAARVAKLLLRLGNDVYSYDLETRQLYINPDSEFGKELYEQLLDASMPM